MKNKKKIILLFLVMFLVPNVLYAKTVEDVSINDKYNNEIKVVPMAETTTSDSAYKGATYGTDSNFICEEGTTNANGITFKGLIEKYWGWVMLLVPVGLIILIVMDFLKATTSNDADALKKASSNMFKRVIAGFLLLLTPWFVNLIMGWFGLTFCF